MALDLIHWKAYVAAAAVILGGTALFALVIRRNETKARNELLGQSELDVLAEHAEAFATLCERYAKRFRAQRALWDALAADERKHSRWIRGFTQRIRAGEGSLRRELLPYGRIAIALGQVQQLAADATNPELTEKSALRNALLQENERADWRLPDLITASSEKFGTTLELLRSEAQAHQRALTAAIERG